jgi:hypothetical protein
MATAVPSSPSSSSAFMSRDRFNGFSGLISLSEQQPPLTPIATLRRGEEGFVPVDPLFLSLAVVIL